MTTPKQRDEAWLKAATVEQIHAAHEAGELQELLAGAPETGAGTAVTGAGTSGDA